jgi:mono/diheme cytochrome c family protein
MSDYLVKSLIATAFVAVGSAAFLSMMALPGRAEGKGDPRRLRKLHRLSGWIFVLLAVPLVLYGLKFISEMGDALALRGVLHVVLAFSFLSILFLKLAVVRFFKQFQKYAPPLGMTVFILAVVMYLMTAGFFFLRSSAANAEDDMESEAAVAAAAVPGRPPEGEALFRENCLSCHSIDGEDRGAGPDLKGLFKRKALPSSGRPPHPANIIRQLKRPLGTMPAFLHLTDQEIADLLAYFLNL